MRQELNFRDLGGIQVKDGRVIKKEKLLRSGGLHIFNRDEVDSYDCNKKQTGEVYNSLCGSHRHDHLRQLHYYYTHMPYGYNAFHVMMQELQADHTPFLFHCAKGKDRTGIAAMIILGALGADDETILQDFLLSNVYRKKAISERVKEGRSTHPEDSGYMELMFLREGVSEAIGQEILDLLHERCGTWENYMKMEYGWDEAALHQFRNCYLEENYGRS